MNNSITMTKYIYLASCLYDSIEDNNLSAINKLLINYKANPNIIIPDRGISPLHLSIGSGIEETAQEITKLFLANGGDPNVRSNEKLTPVHIAAAWGRINILKLLLNCGGDPTLKDENGKTPLNYAREEGLLNIVEFLENYLYHFEQETRLDKVLYDIALDKVIFNNGNEVAEYEVSHKNGEPESLTCDLNNILDLLPKQVADSYVYKWCVIHAQYHDYEYGNKKKDPLKKSDIMQIDFLPNIHIVNNKESVNNCKNGQQNNNDMDGFIINDSSSSQSSNKDEVQNENIVVISNDLYFNNTSEGSYSRSNISPESGILTIPPDTSLESNSIDDLLNKCIIINNASDIESSSAYLTCESINSLGKNIMNSLMTLDLSDQPKQITENELLNITSDLSDNNQISNHFGRSINTDHIYCQLSSHEEFNDSEISITEEYKYVDEDKGIALIEKRVLVNSKINDCKITSSEKTTNTLSSKVSSSLPSLFDYDTDILRVELIASGEPPGPITKTTKRVYLKKLKRLKRKPIIFESNSKQVCNKKVYSVELEKTLRNPNWTNDLSTYIALETVIVNQFSNPDQTKRWREGFTKASFTYLLLDPRITNNLPGRYDKLQPEEAWKCFLSAIFYVGKGKRSRPYSHLYQAVTHWNRSDNTYLKNLKTNKKIDHILNIWTEKFGVICLHIFQNVIPVEAYTREAAMISALKLDNLCNAKSGDFYGISATWPERQKRLLGVYLLYRAMQIFLNEGERQLRPDDIGK